MVEFPYDGAELAKIIDAVQAMAIELPIPEPRKGSKAVKALKGWGVNHQQLEGMGHFYFFGPLGAVLCQLEIYFTAHAGMRRTSLLPYVIRVKVKDYTDDPVLRISPIVVDGKWTQDAGEVSMVRKGPQEYGILMPTLRRLKAELRDQHLDAYHHLEIKKAEEERGSPFTDWDVAWTEEELQEINAHNEEILREANWPSD